MSIARREFNRQRRQERGLAVQSQEQLAESLGITPRSLQRALQRHLVALLAQAIARRRAIGDRPARAAILAKYKSKTEPDKK
jgi:hypothetical protein